MIVALKILQYICLHNCLIKMHYFTNLLPYTFQAPYQWWPVLSICILKICPQYEMSFCSPSEEKNSSRENWEKKRRKREEFQQWLFRFLPQYWCSLDLHIQEANSTVHDSSSFMLTIVKAWRTEECFFLYLVFNAINELIGHY